jgi:Holliday junction DNA helicase RuvA
MIAHLRGRLLEKQPNRLIVDVQGVGYELQVPLSTFYETADPGTEVALRVHTHVREDQIALFAFATSLEQALFERLITVSGVGPKLALAALSGIEPADLARAIRDANIARLTRIPGIGRKTAERISLELKDKVLGLVEAAAGAPGEPDSPPHVEADVVSALVNLGYQRTAAEKAAASALESDGGDAPIDRLLRRALRTLSR